MNIGLLGVWWIVFLGIDNWSRQYFKLVEIYDVGENFGDIKYR